MSDFTAIMATGAGGVAVVIHGHLRRRAFQLADSRFAGAIDNSAREWNGDAWTVGEE